jgi:hypothetical protein
VAKGKTKQSKQRNSQQPLHYRTGVDVHQMVINKSVMALKVPTVIAQKKAQGLLSKAMDDGITPYYLKQETLDRLSGMTHHE